MADKKVFNNLDLQSVNKLINVPNSTASGEVVTHEQLNAAIEGMAWKDNVRVSTQSNINLASPGASIDGVTMASGDRVLVRAQTTASQNGIYIWNGAAVTMARSDDASTSNELENAFVPVDEGSNAGDTYRQTAVNFTLDTDPVTFTSAFTSSPPASETQAGIAEIATQAETNTGTDNTRFITPSKLANSSLVVGRYASSFGDGTATQYTLTHNLGSLDVVVDIVEVSTGDTVGAHIRRTSINAVQITVTPAPAANALRAVIKY